MTSSKEEQKLIATSNKVIYIFFFKIGWNTNLKLWLLNIFFFLPQSPLLNSCITEATTSIHTPGEFFSTDIKLYFSKLDFFFWLPVEGRSCSNYSPIPHSNSDDNMLKNIELFDKLSLRFNGRVLFIKDVIGDEICCWSFYGQGRKIAEVCCTSIVYATEKKQTKVCRSYYMMFYLLFSKEVTDTWCVTLSFFC